MIFVSVGTFTKGFDELIMAMDEACAQTGFTAFAQIGNSSVVPRNMQYARFLSADEMQRHLRNSSMIVCHGGFGIIGDAMREKKPIIVVPRCGNSNSSNMPANNQLLVAKKLQDLYGISVCVDLNMLEAAIRTGSAKENNEVDYKLECNIPMLVADFICGTNSAQS